MVSIVSALFLCHCCNINGAVRSRATAHGQSPRPPLVGSARALELRVHEVFQIQQTDRRPSRSQDKTPTKTGMIHDSNIYG